MEALRLEPHCQDEVMARQLIDAWHAMSVLAPEYGLDWLIHIDSDELFDPGAGTPAGVLFWRMSVAGARCSTFQNWEAVPEVDGSSNPFATHTLFKKPIASLPKDASTTFWEQRHGSTYQSYFLFYDNGKAACRVEPGHACRAVVIWVMDHSQSCATRCETSLCTRVAARRC